MELTFQCANCGQVNHVPALEAARIGRCARCGVERPLHREAIEENQLLTCPYCATADLYIQKDFPQGLGLFIVIVGFVISTIFWYFEMPVVTYVILLTSALLDMLLYYRVPNVTICYRCLSQVRGVGSDVGGRYQPFDLAIGERYRQERLRIEELRKRRETIESPSAPLTKPPVEST